MKKGKKFLLAMALALACTITVPYVANADTVEIYKDTQNVEYSESTLELMQSFPEFEQLLKTQSTGKLITESETYIRFIPKADEQSGDSIASFKNEQLTEKSIDDIKSNFNIEEFTKEEYEMESAFDNISSRFYIGDQVSPSCSWLRLDLQVYQGVNANYDVYSFAQWLTTPFCTFKDVIGISVSEGMMIAPEEQQSRKAQYLYKPIGLTYSQGKNLSNSDLVQEKNGKGILGKFQVRPDVTNHRFMINAGVKYIAGSSITEGYIYSDYVHAELGIGGISMGSNGRPAVSGALKSSSHTGYRYVNK